MAAAAIPILTAAMPLLIPIGRALVVQVEHLFGAKSGAAKANAVYDALGAVAAQMAEHGKIPAKLDSASITAIIEAIVAEMNSRGILNPASAAAMVAAGVTSPQPSVNQGITLTGSFVMAPQTTQTP